jgi:hypothetical protein
VGGLIYIPHPRSRVRPFGSRVRLPSLQYVLVRARARCRIRPHPDKCLHRNGYARIAFHPREDTVFAPGPTHLRPLTCVCTRRAKHPHLVPRVRTLGPRLFPPVRAQSHPPAPISTCSHPMRSRFYQRAYAADHAGDQCAPAVISPWCPLQPRVPPAVYKPVRAP